MRQFKFRGYDPVNKKMVFADLHETDEIESWVTWDKPIDSPTNSGVSFDVMQYTGLKDKNGVEIYEGDIVRILYTDWPSQQLNAAGSYSMGLDDYRDSISNIGKVVFSECEFCIQFNDDGYTSSIFPGTHGQITVIGNIYENPELIEIATN